MEQGRRSRDRLLRDLAQGTEDLATIAARHRMSLPGLARWMEEPGNRLALRAVCRAADVQAELALSQYRLHAATRLVRLATAEAAQKGDETIRRACQDVLRLQPPGARGGDEREEVSEAEAREALMAALAGCEASDDEEADAASRVAS